MKGEFHMHNDSTTPPPLPIAIPYENGDEPVHRPPYYYCRATSHTLDCLCRQSEELKAVLLAMMDAGEIDGAGALEIFWGLA